MKKFKKLIPALCMLLVSAVMLGSTTFAWFSMNNKVTATGMQVTAKANTKFLVINNGTTLPTDSQITDELTLVSGYGMTVGSNNNNVYPVRYNSGNTELSLTIAGNPTSTQNVPTGTWFTAFSNDYNSSTGTGLLGYKQLYMNPSEGQTGLNNYVLKYQVALGLASGSDSHSDKVTITPTFGSSAATCALVVINSEKLAFDNISNKKAKTTSADVTLNSTTAVVVDIYVYIDGAHESVKSSETNAISGTLSLEFTVAGIVS